MDCSQDAPVPDDPTTVGNRVGAFRYFRAQDRWEWSDAVAEMHGYPPGQVQPTTALVMSHKHPDDAASVALLIETVTGQGRPFSSRHRIIDKNGDVHLVLVIGERMRDDNGDVIGTQGLYVDLSNVDETGTVDAAIADFTEHRAIIEQAKGVLMLTYGISAERAFDILVWRSQDSNTKLRRLARQVVDDFTTTLQVPTGLRERADHLLLTAHQRITPMDSRSDAC
ncbi:PAS and ANTAR domain-containing protein [Mycolicibacterium flavescens]|uniref:PAS and ANTAR domain-containing protein n=1 Tax=Mycolicibacterium flavescens TaxID=1776 RepID=UPI001F2BA41B|nr:PAS and ANTAR domain-containing protein [Mycolicibacterium flavescens]